MTRPAISAPRASESPDSDVNHAVPRQIKTTKRIKSLDCAAGQPDARAAAKIAGRPRRSGPAQTAPSPQPRQSKQESLSPTDPGRGAAASLARCKDPEREGHRSPGDLGSN